MKKIYLLIISVLMMFSLTACSDSHNSAPPETGPPVLSDGDVVSFTLLQTTDVHHRAGGSGSSLTFSPDDGIDNSGGTDQTQGGYARLTTKIARVRLAAMSQGIPTVLVDSGDFLMGTVYDLTMGDSPAAFYFMEFMDYDAVTFGNHEFDYGPAGLAMILNNARGEDGSGFTVPIVASNMETDGVAGTDDDGIEAFAAAGAIRPTLVKTLDNGLKVGIMGLLGNNAENDAPLAGPVTFDHDYAAIQQTVDHLKNDLGAHIVIILSHSGITDPEGTPGGDDILLAQNVTGIDIIASGHEHEMTPEIVTENGTRIICAGYYGKNLAQLDVTVEVGAGVSDAALTNHPIDDATPGDPSMNFVVDMFDAGIDEALKPQLGIGIKDVVAVSGSANLGIPVKSEETGMGNLVADSLRYMLGGMDGGIGIVATGVLREGFEAGELVTFADMYSVVPLGMTVDPTQQDVPGYPLMQVNLTGAHVKNMCQLAAYVIAAGDEAFMAQLANPAHPYHALYFALVNLKSSYNLNLSGLRYTHAGAAGMYQIVPGSVTLYNGQDFKCEGQAAVPVEDDAFYPCVMDIYMYFVMQSADLQMLLGALNLPIVPLDNSGQPVTLANMLDSRLDRDPATAGIQEVKEWMAFLTFLTAAPEAGGFADHIIPDANYGQAALETGDASRVNELSLVP
ncbi:MAG: metallophosphoesterase [Desulfosalsimonadaceae bacterium]